jgi:cysteine peptidase C11 family protein
VRTHSPRPARWLAAAVATVATAATATLAVGLGDSSQAVAPAADDAAVADWTMMVYAVGDTVSVPELMVENLNEIAQLPDEPGVNVVVLVDLPALGSKDAPTQALAGQQPFSTAKLLALHNHQYTQVKDLGELSMGDPATLSSFVAEAAAEFPATHYGFTFFDHGGGNTGGYVDTGPPTTQELSVPQMRAGLIEGMQQAGIARFDVIDQAACLMANYETLSALAPLGKWLGGSEEEMIQYPLAPASFTPMGQGGDGQDVAQGFVSGYVDLLDEIATQQGGQPYRDLAALSVVDGDAVSQLDAAMASFSQAAIAHMDEITPQIAQARANALEFVISLPGSEGSSFDLVDLGDFMKHLTNVPDDVAVARDAVSAAITRSVAAQATGQGTQQATGMNVYLPGNPRQVNQDVLTDGTEPPAWAEFVQAYVTSALGSSGNQGGGVRFTSQQAQVLQADASGVKIAGQLVDGARANVAEADTYVFTDLGGQSQGLALVLPAYLDAGGPGQVQGTWNYGLTSITDGKKVAPVTTQYQAQAGGLLGTFLAHYVAPNGAATDIQVHVLLSSQGKIQSITAVDVNGQASAGVRLQIGGTLTPYIAVPSSGGFQRVPSTQTITITKKLDVVFAHAAKGSAYEMDLVVFDAAGNGAGSGVHGTVQ